MAERRIAVIDPAGAVINALVADEIYVPPDDGNTYMDHASAGPGWQLVDGELVPPPQPVTYSTEFDYGPTGAQMVGG